jgi:hypothetical protein
LSSGNPLADASACALLAASVACFIEATTQPHCLPPAAMSALLPSAERVLGDVDLVGLLILILLDDEYDEDDDDDDEGLQGVATRAAHSLCLTSKSVRAAVLASVQSIYMNEPLPVLQQMVALASLHIGPGPVDLSQLAHLTRLQADDISSPQDLSAIMQLTRLRELWLDSQADDGEDMRRALRSISRLSSLTRLGIDFSEIRQLPDTIGPLTALTSLDLSGCNRLQQLPAIIGQLTAIIGQLTALTRLDLSGCYSLEQLLNTIGDLTTLSSLDLDGCYSLEQLPNTIGDLPTLSSLDLSACSSLLQLPDAIGNLTTLSSLALSECSSLLQLPDTIGQLKALPSLKLSECSSLQQLPDSIGHSSQPSPA